MNSTSNGTLIKEHETCVLTYFKTACVTLIKIGHTTFGIKFDWSTCHDNLGIIINHLREKQITAKMSHYCLTIVQCCRKANMTFFANENRRTYIKS